MRWPPPESMARPGTRHRHRLAVPPRLGGGKRCRKSAGRWR